LNAAGGVTGGAGTITSLLTDGTGVS
jgi:hypothetical protein